MCGSLPVVASLNLVAACGSAPVSELATCCCCTAIVECHKAEQTPPPPPPPLATQSHLKNPPSVPADKRYITRVDVIVGLCGGRWPGDCVWKQEEPLSLD